jgi:energy-coupling factor transporter ATP-binding protein EcfA2
VGSHLIVITGPRESGKTTLARTLEQYEGYKAHNVGDLLADQLEREGALPADREDIGQAYLDMFGIENYARAVEAAAGSGVVLDGVRLPSALASLRSHPRSEDLIHLARPGRGGLRADEPFAADVIMLQEQAYALVEWQNTVGELRDVVGHVLRKWEAEHEADTVRDTI